MKCDRMCVCHSHSLQNSYCMMFYTITKKKCYPFSWYKTRFVWFSQFIMTVVQKLGYFEQKRWPGTGSSPKTAGSQSVKARTCIYIVYGHCKCRTKLPMRCTVMQISWRRLQMYGQSTFGTGSPMYGQATTSNLDPGVIQQFKRLVVRRR